MRFKEQNATALISVRNPLSTAASIALTASVAILIGTTQKSLHAEDKASRSWSEPELPAAHQATLLQPFWVGNRISNEPILFLKEPSQPYATARLLFVPTKLLHLSSVNGAIEFVEGKDYTWKHGSNLLTLTQHSRIPFKTVAEMHPPIGAPNTLGKTKDGKSSLYFIGNGPEFQNIQPLATYEHKQKWLGHIPPSGKSELARTVTKLSTKQSVNIMVFGDSISTGASASSMFNEFPYQPGYPDIVADGLRFHYGAPISVTNLSEGGQDSRWATSQIAKVVAAKPDLVILGFGMNDASRRFTGEEYAKNIQTVVSEIRRALPETDFILIATMVGNPEWDQTVPELYTQYREVLLRMKQPGIAVADLTTVWQEMLQIKKFDDITANGLNHPNDFGQRTYAHVILQLMQ